MRDDGRATKSFLFMGLWRKRCEMIFLAFNIFGHTFWAHLSGIFFLIHFSGTFALSPARKSGIANDVPPSINI